MKIIQRLCAVALLLLLSGCGGTTYTINIDSITDQDSDYAGTRYILYSGMKDVSADDLYFREFATYFRTIIAQHGYKEVINPDKADIAIYLSYGVTPGELIHYTYTTPVFEVTGGEIIQYSETKSDGRGSTTQTTGTIQIPVRQRIIGHTAQAEQQQLYTRYVILEATETSNSNRSIWKTTLKSLGLSKDLRRIMPIIATASAPFLGSNTGQLIEIEIDDDDEKVIGLQKILLQSFPTPKTAN